MAVLRLNTFIKPTAGAVGAHRVPLRLTEQSIQVARYNDRAL